MVLGDSYMVGNEVGFEDTFARQLGDRHGVEVINLAVGGYGTIQERIVWQELGRDYRPEWVLLAVYLGNDLGDNNGFPNKYCVIDGILSSCSSSESSAAVRGLVWLARHSLVARLLLRAYRRYERRDDQRQAAPARTGSASSATPPPPDPGPVIRGGRSAAGLYARQWSPSYQRGFERLMDNIQQLNVDSNTHGARLAVVVIPAESQIYDWRWDTYVAERGLNPKDYDQFRVVRLLTGFLQREDIVSINLLPALRRAAINDPDLHPGRWHWSPAANRLAAEVVGDALSKRLSFPPPVEAPR